MVIVYSRQSRSTKTIEAELFGFFRRVVNGILCPDIMQEMRLLKFGPVKSQGRRILVVFE